MHVLLQQHTLITRKLLSKVRNHVPQFVRVLATTNLKQDIKNNQESKDAPIQTLASRLVNHSPNSIQPYLRLIRLDRPIGTWLLYWPCTWSIAAAANNGCFPDVKTLLLFGTGAIVMRGAGCVINDLWDRDLDARVKRTASRPITTGEINTKQALIYLAGLSSIGLAVLLQLNTYSIALGALSLCLVVTYPLAKRYTNWPQLILGLTFNWGALLGYSAIQGHVDPAVCLPLYAAGVSWTIVYDTIYAYQDAEDDRRIGVKSTAVHFGEHGRIMLSCFGMSMLSSLILFGYLNEATWPFYVATGTVGVHVASQIYTLNIHNRTELMRKFLSNSQVGFFIFCGIVLSILLKDQDSKSKVTPVIESNKLSC